MEESDLKKIQDTVAAQIQVTVNGKLDKQHLILERQNEVMNGLITKLDNHIIQHDKDQEDMKPMLNSFNDWSSFRKILWSIFVPLIGLLSAIGGVQGFLALFKR